MAQTIPTPHPLGNDLRIQQRVIQTQQAVRRLVASQGEVLVQRILTGMMFNFPRDCFPDASGVLLGLFEIMPQETVVWVKGTIGMLPAGTVRAAEGDRLVASIGQKIQAGDARKIRVLMQGKFCSQPPFSTWAGQVRGH